MVYWTNQTPICVTTPDEGEEGEAIVRLFGRKVMRCLITGLLAVVITLGSAQNSFAAFFESQIDDVLCDNGANPALDDVDGTKPAHQKSCIGQNININNFTVFVSWDPDKAWAAAFGILGGWAGVATAEAWAIATGRGHAEIHIGETKTIYVVTAFEVKLEGDKACVYAHPVGIFEFTVGRSGALDAVLSDVGSLPSNCVYAPAMRQVMSPPTWGNLISRTCTRYCQTDTIGGVGIKFCASQQKNPFTGVAVQCIEDTMTNILFLGKDTLGNTFFSNMQNDLKGAIRALLALYIIFLGMQHMMGKKGMGRGEWQWAALKIGLVFYFAAGPGMIDLYPQLVALSKGFSQIVLNGSMGTSVDAGDAYTDAAVASQDYDQARDAMVSARVDYNSGPTAATLTALNTANANVNVALNALNRANAVVDTFGYNYCNFRDYDYTGYKDMDPISLGVRTRDMSFMQLWDTVDCKIAKYLGIGDNIANDTVPQIVMIAIAAIFSTIYGVIIFFLIMIYMVFVTMVALRTVHIYIIAFIGLSLLVYMSPLIIPAVLFKFTRQIFAAWVKQVIAYVVQPMMLFAFLTFVFAVFDHVIYGDNHTFFPLNWGDQTVHAGDYPAYYTGVPSEQAAKAKLDVNKIILNPDGTCQDEDSVGCIYRKATFASTEDNGLGATFRFTTLDIDDNQGRLLMLNLLKLIFICFILNAAALAVESTATRLTDAAGFGASGMSALRTADAGSAWSKSGINLDPVSIGMGVGKATKMALKVPAKTVGVAAKVGRKLVGK